MVAGESIVFSPQALKKCWLLQAAIAAEESSQWSEGRESWDAAIPAPSLKSLYLALMVLCMGMPDRVSGGGANRVGTLIRLGIKAHKIAEAVVAGSGKGKSSGKENQAPSHNGKNEMANEDEAGVPEEGGGAVDKGAKASEGLIEHYGTHLLLLQADFVCSCLDQEGSRAVDGDEEETEDNQPALELGIDENEFLHR